LLVAFWDSVTGTGDEKRAGFGVVSAMLSVSAVDESDEEELEEDDEELEDELEELDDEEETESSSDSLPDESSSLPAAFLSFLESSENVLEFMAEVPTSDVLLALLAAVLIVFEKELVKDCFAAKDSPGLITEVGLACCFFSDKVTVSPCAVSPLEAVELDAVDDALDEDEDELVEEESSSSFVSLASFSLIVGSDSIFGSSVSALFASKCFAAVSSGLTVGPFFLSSS
jgi:hypothetical protein